MFRLFRFASYALFGYAVYELLQGICEGQEGHAPVSTTPTRRPLRSGEPGRGVISER